MPGESGIGLVQTGSHSLVPVPPMRVHAALPPCALTRAHCIAPCEEGRPAGRAQGRGRQVLGQLHTLAGHAVDVGSPAEGWEKCVCDGRGRA